MKSLSAGKWGEFQEGFSEFHNTRFRLNVFVLVGGRESTEISRMQNCCWNVVVVVFLSERSEFLYLPSLSELFRIIRIAFFTGCCCYSTQTTNWRGWRWWWMRQSSSSNSNNLGQICVFLPRKGVFNKFFSLEILLIPLLQRSWQCATHTSWYHFNSFFIRTLLYCHIQVCVSPSSSRNEWRCHCRIFGGLWENNKNSFTLRVIQLWVAQRGYYEMLCVFCFKKNKVRNYTGWHRKNRSNLTFVFSPSVSNRASGRTRGSPQGEWNISSIIVWLQARITVQREQRGGGWDSTAIVCFPL